MDDIEPPRAAARPRTLYRAVWRWHFYAGLFAIPVIALLCVSGIVYLFKPQLNELMYGDLMKVRPGAAAVPYEQQRAAVLERYPGAAVGSIFTPDGADRSTQFDITTAAGASRTVWVDPYGGQVLGSRDNAKDVVKIAKELHGTLLTGRFLGDEGKWGDRYVELVAGWTVVLLVTGVYLWWPRGRRKRSLAGVLTIRKRERNRRTFWRDLHAVTGIVFSFVTLFFLVTGLAWTGYWGAKFSSYAAKADGYYNGAWDFSAQSKVGDVLPNGESPWAVGSLPLLPSGAPGQPAPIDAVVATARGAGLTGSIVLTPPSDAKGSWFVGRYEDTDAAPNRSSLDQRILYVDQYSAEVISDYDYGDYGTTGKVTTTGISLHEGREWGIWSQLLALAGALAVLLSMASALVMWRKRRPGGLGAPRKEPDRRIGFGVLAVMAGLGVLFPLVGLSMVVLLVGEFFVLRRIPPVARALGMAATGADKIAAAKED